MAIAAGLMTKPLLAIFDSLCILYIISLLSKVLLKLNFFLFFSFLYAFTQSDKCVVSLLFYLSYLAEGSRILLRNMLQGSVYNIFAGCSRRTAVFQSC